MKIKKPAIINAITNNPIPLNKSAIESAKNPKTVIRNIAMINFFLFMFFIFLSIKIRYPNPKIIKFKKKFRMKIPIVNEEKNCSEGGIIISAFTIFEDTI